MLEGCADLVQPGWRDVRRASAPDAGDDGEPRAARRIAAAAGAARGGDPGLWLAGDWVGDRGLLADAAVASAETVARAIASAGRPRGRWLDRGRPRRPHRLRRASTRSTATSCAATATGLTGSVADANDLVQETFVRAHRAPAARHRRAVAAVAGARRHQPAARSPPPRAARVRRQLAAGADRHRRRELVAAAGSTTTPSAATRRRRASPSPSCWRSRR